MKQTGPALIARFSTELVVIVIGVLAALAADDWWAERRERTEEAQILSALADDVTSARIALGAYLERQEGLLESIRVLSSGSEGRVSEIDISTLSSMIWTAIWDAYAGIPSELIAYEEIKNSGRLGLIRGFELRRSLAEYDRQFARIVQDANDLFQHQTTKLDPYALETLEFRQFSEEALERFDDAAALSSPMSAGDYRHIIDDEYFQNLIASKYFLQSRARDRQNDLLKILENLEIQIAERLNMLDES